MLEEDRIIKINIENEMKSAYIDYSMSVIVSRALPDVRDGLKPVHRRVLYGMNEMGNTSDKPTRKSAKAVGEVMGKYHPHGDGSIYGTIVRMAQPWAMRECLVEGQGNFGSIDGDGPATPTQSISSPIMTTPTKSLPYSPRVYLIFLSTEHPASR